MKGYKVKAKYGYDEQTRINDWFFLINRRRSGYINNIDYRIKGAANKIGGLPALEPQDETHHITKSKRSRMP